MSSTDNLLPIKFDRDLVRPVRQRRIQHLSLRTRAMSTLTPTCSLQRTAAVPSADPRMSRVVTAHRALEADNVGPEPIT
jgi:hypothetical protein